VLVKADDSEVSEWAEPDKKLVSNKSAWRKSKSWNIVIKAMKICSPSTVILWHGFKK
jgi:hypothetical protein